MLEYVLHRCVFTHTPNVEAVGAASAFFFRSRFSYIGSVLRRPGPFFVSILGQVEKFKQFRRPLALRDDQPPEQSGSFPFEIARQFVLAIPAQRHKRPESPVGKLRHALCLVCRENDGGNGPHPLFL